MGGGHPPLGAGVDYTWAQYQTRKGEPKAYYDAAAATRRTARPPGGDGRERGELLRPDTDACSAADLQRFGTLAVTHPGELRVHQLEVRAGAVGGSGGAGGVGRAVRGGAGAGGGGVREGELRPECRL